MKDQKLKILNKFLIRHQAFDYFYHNIDPLLKNSKFKITESSIDGLFIWGLTPEGIDYWKKLSLLWEKEFQDLFPEDSLNNENKAYEFKQIYFSPVE